MFTITSNKEVKKLKRRQAILEAKMVACDTQHAEQVGHNRRYDDIVHELKPLVPAVRELTEAVKSLKQKDASDAPVIARVQNDFTTWDTISEVAKRLGAIGGMIALLISAGYGLLNLLGVTIS